MAQLISNLAVGAKVKFGNYKVESEALAPLIWKVADKNHTGYPANSVTLITEKIIDFRGFDAKEPTNTNAGRQNYGNNRYLHANMRQWLNDAGASWWAASQTYDATPNNTGMSEPTGYDDKPGFKDYFTADELGALLDTTLTVAKNTVTDSGGSETVVDKFFLASTTEVGLANENSIVEGSLLSLFSNDASRIAYATQAAITNSLSTSKPANTSSGWYWWLRTPSSTNSCDVRVVGSSGTLYNSIAYYGSFGLRPLSEITKAEVMAFRAKLAELPGRGNKKLSAGRMNLSRPLTRACPAAAPGMALTAAAWGFPTPPGLTAINLKFLSPPHRPRDNRNDIQKGR